MSVCLASVCEFIVDCLHDTAPIQEQGYPLIRTPNIGKGRLLLDNVYRVSQDTYDRWTKRAVPLANDLILAREAPAGNVAIINEGQEVVLGQRTVHLRPDITKIDPVFLCYFLLAPSQQAKLLASATGATAKHVNMKDIRALELTNLPELPVQKKLGLIIANYDDLIENNRRRIQLLEESARLLYQEWFVRLNFPNAEHTKIVDGIPEGWDKGSVSDLGKVVTGKTPPTDDKDNYGDFMPFIKTPDMHDSSIVVYPSEYLSEKGVSIQKNKNLPPHSILVACIGAKLGVVALNAYESQTNQQINTVIPSSDYLTYYAYFLLKGFRENLLAIGGGATMPNVNKAKFEAMSVMIPAKNILEQFHDKVAHSFQLMKNLIIANYQLAQARDLLLPKLMNGEIEV